jgi:DNA-directed RNA polymerase subunit RPC12/RpoP
MNKENRFLFFEAMPGGPEKSRKGVRRHPSFYKKQGEKVRELREAEKPQDEESERVAEKIMDELELMGIKCPKCGEKDVKSIDGPVEGAAPTRLKCRYCGHEWEEEDSANADDSLGW